MKPQEIILRIVLDQPKASDEFVEVGGDAKKRSPSQLLRLSLMRLHERQGGDKSTFEAFYEAEMNRIILVTDNRK